MKNQIPAQELSCALCSMPIRQKGYLDAENAFCCSGCQAVYQILSCQKALNNFHEHPLFKQALNSGLISNPELLEQLHKNSSESDKEEYKKLHLEILDMWCPSCAKVIYLILMQKKGVRQCVVDYSTDLASIEYYPKYISKEKIYQIIAQLGYRVVALEDSRQQAVSLSLYLRFIVAAFFSVNIMMFSYPIYAGYFHSEPMGYSTLFSWLSLAGSIPVLTYSAWPIWRRFISGLRVGIWGMELLVLIGVTAAFGLSLYELFNGTNYVYFDSMTIIIVFVLLGKIIESKAKFSSKDSLLRLTRALPRRARKLFADGTEQFVPLKEIQLGEHIVVITGEKIALDGLVIEGEGACDESLMTGESIPLIKKVGSTVLSGSILQQGRIVIQVTAQLEESALQRIITMVEQDMGEKPQHVRLVDSIVRWFVPFVLFLALLTGFYCWLFKVADPGYTPVQTAIIRAISILLISCPCAIGIAVPLAESHILNALAKMGAILRNRVCLAFIGRETVFVFDKTGTITEGKFSVLNGLKDLAVENQMVLKGLVSYSNHPISVAINQALLCFPKKLELVEELIGKGIRGKISLDSYIIGSSNFLKEQNVVRGPTESSTTVQTKVYFAKNQECLSEIVLGDTVRSEVPELLKSMDSIKKILLSGDSVSTVKMVGEKCGFDQWYAECNPLQKRELIHGLKEQGEIVAMLGDGINDAPALMAAHIGIAVVSATDISVQVSDLLLTTDRLSLISRIRMLGQRGHKIVKQNLFWAFFYNVIGIGLAMAGLLSPLFAAFAMVTSSFIVLINAQRIKEPK